jgi:hypothetical protein
MFIRLVILQISENISYLASRFADYIKRSNLKSSNNVLHFIVGI